LLVATAAAAYLERQRKLQARVPGDKADQVEQETAEWIHDDVRGDRADRDPAFGGQGCVACETVLHTETGRNLPTLVDSGAQVSALIDKEELKLEKPGADYVELHGNTPELHGFGSLRPAQGRQAAHHHHADQERERKLISIVRRNCLTIPTRHADQVLFIYAAGPTVRAYQPSGVA
jgi:hypothetical protein